MCSCNFCKIIGWIQSAAFKTLCTISYNLSEQLFVICKTYQSQGKSKQDVEINWLYIDYSSVYFLPQSDLLHITQDKKTFQDYNLTEQ